jgi:hypothetical protein
LFALAAGLLAAAPGSGTAQQFGGWSYQWSMPMGDLEEFVPNDSWIGFALEGHRFVAERVSLGLEIGYYAFYENTDEAIELPAGAVGGTQYRHLSTMPILLNLSFYAGKVGGPRPYLGVNIGAYFFDQLLNIGVVGLSDTEWIIGFAPEAGIVFRGRPGTAVALKVRYNYPSNAGNFIAGQPRSFQYLSVGLALYGIRGRL